MAFGGTMVDNYGVTDDFPGASLLVGLFGNALGWFHRDVDRLQALQSRLLYAVREDRRGRRLTDYQTVDLGQPHLVDTGWTTHGVLEGRAGAFSTGTHIRYRDYLADASYTVVVGLSSSEFPTLDDLASALKRPARPLFIGRKTCLPSLPLLVQQHGHAVMVTAPTPRDALFLYPSKKSCRIWFPVDDEDHEGHTHPFRDHRDWRNQVHVGQRLIRMEITPEDPHDD